MDSKELRGLMEAYSEVYAPQEEIDEALTGERYKKVIKKPGGMAYSRKVSADPSKRATRGGRGGESDFGAGDRGSGNRAARRAGTYQEEEFEIDEAVKGASPHAMQMRKDAASERKAGAKDRLSPSEGKANAAKMQRDIKFYDKITKKTKPSVVGMTHEEVDIFDVVLEFLQAEGYAETLEEAEWMMANVIDKEAIDIILGEAQHARENPEKYEREQEKRTSKREKAMNDPHKGINSPAFAEFMRKQMGR